MVITGCSTRKDSTDSFDISSSAHPDQPVKKRNASTRVDLENKGVGVITSITLSEEPDQALVDTGRQIFELKCTACHKPAEKFIGPAPKDILKRRTPEWVMNMILDPERMVKEDSLAKDLFMEYNGVPMANQGLTREEARAVLEYFRTL